MIGYKNWIPSTKWKTTHKKSDICKNLDESQRCYAEIKSPFSETAYRMIPFRLETLVKRNSDPGLARGQPWGRFDGKG